MFLKRIFKGIPDMGPWLSVAELFAALATVIGVLVGLNVVPNPFVRVASGTISGIVTDVATGQPVPESTIQIVDNLSQTMISESVPDGKGGFKETVKPGAYTVKAVCDGYCPTQKSVSVLENKSRIVRLAIKQRTEAEAKAAAAVAAPAGAVPQTKIITVAVPGGGNGGGSSPRAVAQSPRAQSGGKSNAALVGEQLKAAGRLFDQGDLQGAEDACLAALKMDPSDGNIYAQLILLNLDGRRSNVAAAKDYADEGRKKAKKNKDKLNAAILELP